MWEKGIVSSVVSCQGRIEAYEPGSLENPKIGLGNIVKPVDAIIQQFSDKSTRVICPYFDKEENFCTALESSSDSEENRRLIADRVSFLLNYSSGKKDESIVISAAKCPYKIDL